MYNYVDDAGLQQALEAVYGDMANLGGKDYTIQYGTMTMSAETTITFATPYKSVPVVVCTPIDTKTGGSGYYIKINVLSKTGFTACAYTYAGLTAFNWVAIGEV